MKKINIFYWVATGLIAAFMILSSISNVISSPEAVELITGLGYPDYIIPFLGIAKVLGSVVILVPYFNRLKEWAYAGLFFDLSGATYSVFSTEGVTLQNSSMLLFIAVLLASYFLWHKKMDLAKEAA